MTLGKKPFEIIVRKGENASNQHFLDYPQCFLLFPIQTLIFQSHLFCHLQDVSISTSLKICCLVKGLKNPLTDDKILALSKWKTFEDYNSIVAQMVQWVENIVGKGENAGNQHFLLFLQWSKRTFSLGCQKFSGYGYGLRHGKFVVCKCLILCLSHLVKN